MSNVMMRNSAGDPGAQECLRTCIGCRQRERQFDLLRIVARGSEVIPDGHGRQAGRGAYLHYEQACLDAANHRQAFSRAFRTGRDLSVESVSRVLQQEEQTDGSQSGDEMSSQ